MKAVAEPRAQDLMTRLSLDEAGHRNVVVARDFRHLFDDWVRREGDELFSAATEAVPNEAVESTIGGGAAGGTRTVESRTRGGTATLIGYTGFNGSTTKYRRKVVSGSMEVAEYPVASCAPAYPTSGCQSMTFPVFFFWNEYVDGTVCLETVSIDSATGVVTLRIASAGWAAQVPGYVGDSGTRAWHVFYDTGAGPSAPITSFPSATFNVQAGTTVAVAIAVSAISGYGVGAVNYIAGGNSFVDTWDATFDYQDDGSIVASGPGTNREYAWGAITDPIPGAYTDPPRPDLKYQAAHTIVWSIQPTYAVVTEPSATQRVTTGLGCVAGNLPWVGGGPGSMSGDGVVTETLSVPDSKSDAITRLLVDATWSDWATVATETDIESCYGADTDNFEYNETEVRISYTGVVPDTNYTVRLQIWRRDADNNEEFVEEVTLTATSDGSGNLVFDDYSLVGEEGYCYFIAEGGITIDGDDPDQACITLIHQGRQDNGKVALIVGTPKSLYRYWGNEDNDIVDPDVVDPDVVGTICNGYWLRIGSDFTALNNHRWEAKNINGYVLFNNGIDLPQSYHLLEFETQPLHELREQGVAFVGCMEEIAGIPVFADIAAIKEGLLQGVMEAIDYTGFANGQEVNINRIHYDVLWGDPVSPLRFGSTVPGAITAGERTLTLAYRFSSLKPYDSVRINGAGENGGDLVTTLLYKTGDNVWITSDEAVTTVTAASVGKSDAASLITGHFEVKDDVSPVIRLSRLQNRLVVAKPDGFVVAEYTGVATRPFIFERVYSGEEGLHWRWTLTELNDKLIYAGKDEFYEFDLVGRRPEQHRTLSLSSNIFFDAVATARQDDVFVSNNGLTKELWFHFPSDTEDKALCYDYKPRDLGGGRCTTLGTSYSAAGMIDVPRSTIQHEPVPRWFLLGTCPGGQILRYLYDQTGPTGWTRRDAEYNSELWSGLADFGDEENAKEVKEYLLMMASQSPNTAVRLSLYGADNANGDLAELPDSPINLTNPKVENKQPLHYEKMLVQERLRVTGTANIRIRKRRWEIGARSGRVERVT